MTHPHHWQPTNHGVEFWSCGCGMFSREWWPSNGAISFWHRFVVTLWHTQVRMRAVAMRSMGR